MIRQRVCFCLVLCPLFLCGVSALRADCCGQRHCWQDHQVHDDSIESVNTTHPLHRSTDRTLTTCFILNSYSDTCLIPGNAAEISAVKVTDPLFVTVSSEVTGRGWIWVLLVKRSRKWLDMKSPERVFKVRTSARNDVFWCNDKMEKGSALATLWTLCCHFVTAVHFRNLAKEHKIGPYFWSSH